MTPFYYMLCDPRYELKFNYFSALCDKIYVVDQNDGRKKAPQNFARSLLVKDEDHDEDNDHI